jgi:preprotein translocase subunit SecE
MAKVTTKEMIDLIDEDIKFALEIGDKEFVGYLKEAKAKLLDTVYPTRNEEYVELFGK